MKGLVIGRTSLAKELFEKKFNDLEYSYYLNDDLDFQSKNVIFSFLRPKDDICRLYRYVRCSNLNSRLIFFCEDKSLISDFIQYDHNVKVVDQDFESFLKTDSNFLFKETEREEFIQIPIRVFLGLEKVSANLFLKLSEHKKIKVLNAGAHDLVQKIEKFIAKDCEFVYVLKKEYPTIVEELARNTEAPFFHDLEPSLKSMYTKDVFDFVYYSLHIIGLNQETFQSTNKLLNLVSSCVKDHESFEERWERLCLKRNYLSEHTLMLSYLSSAIVDEMKLPSIDANLKLVASSVFHDIALSSGKVERLIDSIHKDSFSRIERKNFENHIQEAVEFVQSINGLSSDVDTIISQHHEKEDGSGFPRGLEARHIHKLSIIFIVAHEFIQELYSGDFSIYHRNKVIAKLRHRYKDKFFLEVVDALSSYFKLSHDEADIQDLAS